jgi:hypothetical protein
MSDAKHPCADFCRIELVRFTLAEIDGGAKIHIGAITVLPNEHFERGGELLVAVGNAHPHNLGRLT